MAELVTVTLQRTVSDPDGENVIFTRQVLLDAVPAAGDHVRVDAPNKTIRVNFTEFFDGGWHAVHLDPDHRAYKTMKGKLPEMLADYEQRGWQRVT